MPAWLLSAVTWIGQKGLKWLTKRVLNKLVKEVMEGSEELIKELEDRAYVLGRDTSVEIGKLSKKVGLPSIGDKHIEPALNRIINKYLLGLKEHVS